MNLSLFEYLCQPDGVVFDGKRVAISGEEREKALVAMREKLATTGDAADNFRLNIETFSGDSLVAEIYRFGLAASTIWSFGGDPIAVSIQMIGKNGKDDAAALGKIKSHQPLFPFSAETYNTAFSQTRPCLAILFLAVEWIQNSQIELWSSALLLATVAPAGSNPTMSLQKPLTPEESAELAKRAGEVGEVFRILQNDWVRKKQLLYTVRPSESVKGRPVNEIMHVKFWVGAQGQGMSLDIEQTAAVFEMLRDYLEQLPGLNNLRKPTTTSTIKLKHEPGELAKLLAQITMVEPLA
jgi:hypothetical protein